VSGTASASETHTSLPGLATQSSEAWRDPALPVDERVEDLLSRMTLEEKVAQLYSVWVGANAAGDDFAPHQHDLTDEAFDWHEAIRAGLGQVTRPLGTAPVEPADGARTLVRMQSDIVAASRFGIPAIAHEECLTGLMTWRATVYPTALAWGATFDPALVERMGAAIGANMRQVGAHQGLAPVLDVTRDPRWGRTEETIGEDPYLVATVGTAYVRGLQSAGVIATLKHFAGYSGSRGARNFGPVAVGPREFSDVYLLPFEMAIRDGGAGSVMHSYAEIDGVPAAANAALLTGVLRDGWGFDGTVVADYFGVSFLQTLHRIAGTAGQAAGLALAAGVDVELPAVRCYGAPLLAALKADAVSEALIDRAARRVLRQKAELGLLDPDWTPTPPALADGRLDLDSAADRALARELAEESVVLLANDGVLPLRPEARLAVVGPQADNLAAMLGCYTFPSHVGSQYPGTATGVEIPTVLAALKDEDTTGPIEYEPGCDVDGTDTSRIAAAAAVAREADVCVVVLGDRAGLFGNGTSGEGCDVPDLRLPGVQADLLEAALATGTPVVLVLLSGRPYALGAYTDRVAAVVQAFFPGEEGGPAVAGVLTGRVCPSGRLPVSVPRSAGGQPWTYLAPMLGHRTEVSTIDPTPAFAFGHGLSYTAFDWDDVRVDGRPASTDDEPVTVRTDSAVSVSLTIRNTGDRAGADVVQLYLHDLVAQVTRPVQRLIGYARVALDAGEARRVTFDVAADLTSFTGLDGRRLVEPGDIELRLGASSVDIRHTVAARLTGPERLLDRHRRMVAEVTVTPSQRG
jgi:beta-xylosidase